MSHENQSKLFTFHFVRTIIVLLLIVLVLIITIDPNDTLSISPPLDRSPAATNQRFSYTSIARQRIFDSLILGTSTTRMLDPSHLSKPLKIRLANLSMNAATTWEQIEIFKLFKKHHKQIKLVIWGMDIRWCTPTSKGPRLTTREFPAWLYDENHWNDYLHLLNFKTIELAGRQFGNIFGLRHPTYYKDGYKSLNKKGTKFDLTKARRNIYKQVKPIAPIKPLKAPAVSLGKRQNWEFPNLATLKNIIISIPSETKLLLMMTPYHQHYIGAVNGRNWIQYNECKKRVKAIADSLANTHYIDFMYRNEFTRNDRNYWDHQHFNEKGALIIENSLLSFLRDGEKRSKIYETVLHNK